MRDVFYSRWNLFGIMTKLLAMGHKSHIGTSRKSRTAEFVVFVFYLIASDLH